MARGRLAVTQRYHVFLSYSRNDPAAAANLRKQLERRGLSVFKDDDSVRAGELWLDRLQEAVDGCGAFVVLVGRDGVRRWIGAETQAALNRYFGPHDDADRLPIFPILLKETGPETLPAFLRLFQMTPWNGADPLPERLLADIRERTVKNDASPFEECPFVGLAAYRADQAHLFFGRQKETLEALACFDTRSGRAPVRWLEINGNSGSGKSSLMQAGLLPLIDQGWLWPRTGYAHWHRIGPMMPGPTPVGTLIGALATAFGWEKADVRRYVEADDDRALADWLCSRKPRDKSDDTAFLLAIDQFEELFTFAGADQRRRFDRLLAAALHDPDCPLFILSTVRADFLDRFGEDAPALTRALNQAGKRWTLVPIGEAGLREVIDGPARLAGLDVDEVREAMLTEARGEPGALPLVENALHWLWEEREGHRLSGRRFTAQGGLAGILSRSADDLLDGLGLQRGRALELLFRLVKVDSEGVRHTRQRIGRDEAVNVAGGGDAALTVVNRLSGQRRPEGGPGAGPLRLITVEEESVNLIHETLIRSKGLDGAGKPQPYWPTLWDYIEKHRERAFWRERLREDVVMWLAKGRGAGHQWSHERVREAAEALQPMLAELSPDEREFLGPIDADAMLAELKRPETTHKRRLLIGERLDVLGDPRPGIGVDTDGTPSIDWRPVPGGEVTISVLSDHLKGEDTRLKRVESFFVAKYPITVAQYRAFVGARDGWCEAAWWEFHPRESGGNMYDFGRFGNHPAINVSWFDAVAFCRWLSRRLGFTVRLPDEWEWQQAATGGDDRNVFPWGADWEANAEHWRANTSESRLGQVTAVGMYPAGASRTGALDLGGTVWELCLNKFDTPNEATRSGPDDFDYCVLRGGSWVSAQGGARSANRYWVNPLFRNNYLGFRLVCSSPSKNTDP